jgi:hypothetical protein
MKTAMTELIEELTLVQRNVINGRYIILNKTLAGVELSNLFEKYLEKEKQQIVDAYNQAYDDCEIDTGIHTRPTAECSNASDYYNQTYNQ